MIGLNIWNKGRLRLLCILVGMLAGYAAGILIGQITPSDFETVLSRPVFLVPNVEHLQWAFDWSMVIPFAVSGLAAAMSATAVVTTYQRLNDADWVRPEPTSLTRGLLGCAQAMTNSMSTSSFPTWEQDSNSPTSRRAGKK